jgi:hypothetical protein
MGVQARHRRAFFIPTQHQGADRCAGRDCDTSLAMSKLLLDIDRRIGDAQSDNERGLWLAQKAYHLPRFSQFDEARELVRRLRSRFADGQQPAILLWIMLAEGTLELYANVEGNARDRILRAQLLAKALGHHQVLAHASAWKALLDFNVSDFESMLLSLKQSLATGELDRFVQARLCLLLSTCHLICGDTAAAGEWRARAHKHALTLGDRGLIEAILYNQAACHIGLLRYLACKGPLDPGELRLVEGELATARNYFQLTQGKSTDRALDVCALRVDLLSGRYVEAIKKIDDLLLGGPFLKESFSPELLALERLFSAAMSGGKVERQSVIEVVAQVEFETLGVDERVVAAWVVAELVKLGELTELAEAANARLELFANVYDHVHAKLSDDLKQFESIEVRQRLCEGQP